MEDSFRNIFNINFEVDEWKKLNVYLYNYTCYNIYMKTDFI